MKIKVFMGLLVFAALAMVTISAIPPWRIAIRNALQSDHREILAKVVTPLTGNSEVFTIFKIKQKDQFFVEVYKQTDPQAESVFLTKIILSDKKDAFFNFQGQATNLAVSDIDHDGVQEILVPAYDFDSTARLNIYKFNEKTNSFDRQNSN